MNDEYMDNSTKAYLREIEKIPLLTVEEEKELGKLILKGDQKAIQKLIEHNLRWVVSLAKKYVKNTNSFSLLDIIQEGNIGLYKAASNFDVTMGNRFSTYATYWIEQAITRALKNKDAIIRNPVHYHDLMGKISKTHQRLRNELDRDPTPLEIASVLNLKEDQVKKAYALLTSVKSLNEKIGDDDVELETLLKNETVASPEVFVLEKIQDEEIRSLLNVLSEKEREIIQMHFGIDGKKPKTLEEISSIYGVSRERIRQIEANSLKKLRWEARHFKEGKSQKKEKDVSYLDLYNFLKEYDFQSFCREYKEFYSILDPTNQKLLHRFLEEIPSIDSLTQEDISLAEQDVNFQYLNEQEFYPIPMDTLKETFYNNKNLFTEEQREKIEKYIIHRQDGPLIKDYYGLLNKLENIYFGIDRILEMRLSKEQMIEVLKKKRNAFSEEEIQYIDFYYGISVRKHTIQEMKDQTNESYQKVHDTLFTALDRALKFYVGYVGREKEITDFTVYEPYIESFQYEVSSETRKLLYMYIKERKNYEEIQKETGLTKPKISNVIQDGLRKIDFYRYGILKVNTFTLEELKEVSTTKKYRNIEFQIIKSRYFDGKSIQEIQEQFHVSRGLVMSAFKKINAYLERRNLPTKVPYSYIQKEISLGPIDSVLLEEEKRVLSMHYGIESLYNETGKKYELQELMALYGKSKYSIQSNISSALLKLKQHMIGVLEPEFGLIPTLHMKEILKDPHIPISKEDKSFLIDLLGLEGKSKSKEEMMEIYQISIPSIKRKYQRALLLLKKYQVGEVEPVYSYEVDILPIMKYFSSYDRSFIKEIYKNHLTAQQIAKKFNITIHTVQNSTKRIQIKLLSILKNKGIAKLYDFEYASKVIDNDDFPLIYQKDLARSIYQRYFGENNYKKSSVPEIIKQMHLPYGETLVHKIIENVMKSVIKYKMGIRKKTHYSYQESQFSHEKIEDYYIRHEKELSSKQRRIFLKILDREYNSLHLNKVSKIPVQIKYLLLQEEGKLPFSFSYTNKGEAEKLLRNQGFHLSHETVKTIQAFYSIPNSVLMSGSDKNKLFKSLIPLYKEKTMNSPKTYTKKKVN